MPPLVLWYSDVAIGQIRSLLHEIKDDFVAIATGEEIRRELGKLASDPPRAQGLAGGPFENRPTHSFNLSADRPRTAHVMYRISQQRNQLEILAFYTVLS